MFQKFESAKDSTRKLALAKEICTELMIHATIEEEIFYPACKEAVDEDQMNEAYVERFGQELKLVREALPMATAPTPLAVPLKAKKTSQSFSNRFRKASAARVVHRSSP